MVKNYPLVHKYLNKIIEKRRKLNDPEMSPLLQIIDNNEADRLEKLLFHLENKVENFEKIFKILPELNNKTDPDEKIDDMIAELRAAILLNNKGFTKIRYQEKSFDFYCKKDSQEYAVEVEFIRGPSFKRQERVGPGLGYKLNPKPVLKKIKNKIKKGFFQIPNNFQQFQKIVVIVTNNIEIDKFWFGGYIEQLRKKIEQDFKSKIFIITNGDIYE